MNDDKTLAQVRSEIRAKWFETTRKIEQVLFWEGKSIRTALHKLDWTHQGDPFEFGYTTYNGLEVNWASGYLLVSEERWQYPWSDLRRHPYPIDEHELAITAARLMWFQAPGQTDRLGPYSGFEILLFRYLELDWDRPQHALTPLEGEKDWRKNLTPKSLRQAVEEASVWGELSPRHQERLKSWCLQQAKAAGVKERKGLPPALPANAAQLRMENYRKLGLKELAARKDRMMRQHVMAEQNSAHRDAVLASSKKSERDP